jgi:hypothetical protein
MNARTLVSCVVSRGFFSSEYYVKLSTGDAYIVDRNNVRVDHEPESRTESVAGKVVAYVIDQRPSDLLIELPGEPVAGGLRSWIPRDDADPLSAAA